MSPYLCINEEGPWGQFYALILCVLLSSCAGADSGGCVHQYFWWSGLSLPHNRVMDLPCACFSISHELCLNCCRVFSLEPTVVAMFTRVSGMWIKITPDLSNTLVVYILIFLDYKILPLLVGMILGQCRCMLFLITSALLLDMVWSLFWY